MWWPLGLLCCCALPELLTEVYRLLVARERENSDAIIHDADDLVI
jgi:hypothetical protein